MDSIFWIGIAIGAFLSLIASIFANLLHTRIVSFLSDSKATVVIRQYKKAASFHALICSYRDGTRDRYLDYLEYYTVFMGSVTAAFVLLSAGFVILELKPPLPPNISIIERLMLLRTLLIFLTTSAVLSYMGTIMFRRIRNISTAIGSFDKFDAEFKRKWGQHITVDDPISSHEEAEDRVHHSGRS